MRVAMQYHPRFRASAVVVVDGNDNASDVALKVFGEPLSQERMRMNRHGDHTWLYDPIAEEKTILRNISCPMDSIHWALVDIGVTQFPLFVPTNGTT